MATQFPPSPSLPPLNPAPSPLGQPGGGQSPDLSALLGGVQGQQPNPLLQNGPQPPAPPTPPGVGGGFNQFA